MMSAKRSKCCSNFHFYYRDKSEFEKKGLHPDVIELKYKHYQGRLMDTINRIIEQRRQIKLEMARAQNRQMAGAGNLSI
jgi:hypothetical protein